jgi:hypothetical protein
MRVGQLARKLGISPTELINFLASVGIQTPEGSNTKLSAEHLQVAIKNFDATGKLETAWQDENKQDEITEEVTAAADLTASETIEPVEMASSAESASVLESVPVAEEASTENSVGENKNEVIKAPKVELAGLKVLGKIELPEKKKKEPPVENITSDTESTTTPTEQPRQPHREPRTRNPRHQGSRNDREATRKNPIALKREQEAAEAERKRHEQAKLEKERRTQHYLSKVKSVPTKPARIIEEEVDELHADQSKTPSTWLGKFWKWFRS